MCITMKYLSNKLLTCFVQKRKWVEEKIVIDTGQSTLKCIVAEIQSETNSDCSMKKLFILLDPKRRLRTGF